MIFVMCCTEENRKESPKRTRISNTPELLETVPFFVFKFTMVASEMLPIESLSCPVIKVLLCATIPFDTKQKRNKKSTVLYMDNSILEERIRTKIRKNNPSIRTKKIQRVV